MKNLVIVESPAKAKTIEKFLGKDYTVKSSYGHIRDLSKKNLGIDISNGFAPDYEIDNDKQKIVAELKESVKKSETIYLASDEDREGEAIAWHLSEVLKLDKKNSKRIVFHEITQRAIEHAIKNPRNIDINLVNAQQARRILDRLVGFEISPLLWKKIKPSLSAGRVQSVAVRLIVEREREIQKFESQSSYRVVGQFEYVKDQYNHLIEAELNKKLSQQEAEKLLNKCSNFKFHVGEVLKKPLKKSPPPPFTTSTLQQEASRKFGFSVSQTMVTAQRLYENGFITYMRTDSTTLSEEALAASKKQITSMFGEKYAKTRKYTTKTKGAQEAHEAIRPTFFQNQQITGNTSDQKLYDLIWKRTLASQMSDAQLEKTTITIPDPSGEQKFIANSEVIQFDGFLKLYIESSDDEEEKDNSQEKLLPPINVGQELENRQIEATQRFTQHPPRYSEATLVKKLEELGIGRPSTYAPTISTIQQRQYVIKDDRAGQTRTVKIIRLKDSKIESCEKTETYNSEKAKLFPTDIGIVVTDYLVAKFDNILSYSFTADIEKDFDDIASGNTIWYEMLSRFYKPFHETVQKTESEKETKRIGERILGTDPKSGKTISVKIGRYGAMAQLGTSNEEEKPRFASLKANQSIETITLQEAIDLFEPPKSIGTYEDHEITFGSGRFGPYLKHNGMFYSIKKTEPIENIDNIRAIEIIEEKRQADANKTIKIFEENPDVKILRGRFGPYIAYQRQNYKIPKTENPETLTLEKCLNIIDNQPSKGTIKKTVKTTNKNKNTRSKR